MTSYTTDNRWSPGASGATIPPDAPAAYSARWIDLGDTADVLPDRQGFAYNTTVGRDTLVALLTDNPAIRDLADLKRETLSVSSLDIMVKPGLCVARRRSGGYVYVDAWLQP